VTFTAFGIGALSIIGVPPFGGVWPKIFLMEGAVASEQPWLIAMLIGSTLLNIGYLLPIVIRAFGKKKPETSPMKPGLPPPLAWVAPLVTAGGTIVLFFMVGPIIDFLSPVFTTEMTP
jgi:multicomponent Na+:H+ antiporter subunit D